MKRRRRSTIDHNKFEDNDNKQLSNDHRDIVALINDENTDY